MNSRYSKLNIQHSTYRGFTLVEMIVAIGLFTIVLFIASSAFLSVLDADRKSRATRIAMDNLNLSLEDMARRIKTGTSYYCGGTTSSTGSMDCAAPGLNSIALTEQDGTRTAYHLDAGAIKRKRGAIGAELDVTAPEITISNLKFIVSGSTIWDPLGSRDTAQPYVTILVEGVTEEKITTGFSIQTTVAQRTYDI